jgi:serine phosphatase RsbU (regulator of sigma subunit)/anti-sigma regulatory factor (Ser/Thr protein kinase)
VTTGPRAGDRVALDPAEPFEVDTRFDQARVLADVASVVHGPVPLEDKLVWITETARELVDATVSAYVVISPGGDPKVAAVSGESESDDLEELALVTVETMLRGDPRLEHSLRVADLDRSPRWSRRNGDARRPVAAWLAVPVLAGDERPRGVLIVGHPTPGHFDDEAEATVAALVSHLAVALDNLASVAKLAQLEAEQREVVHQLQEAVRPPTPVTEASELGVHYLSADPTAPTGGDLYDWLVLPNGDLYLAVVDVMGKGVSATKEALSVTHAVRLLVLEGCPLAEIVVRADELVSAQSPELVATLVIVRYRPDDGFVELAGAGHPPSLLVRADRTCEYVYTPGVPIGWPGAGSHEVVTLTLDRRDTLVLYTDGLIEAGKDILLGLDALAAAAAETARYPASSMARALVERALAGAARRDDSLALVLRRRVPPPPSTAHPLGDFEYHLSRQLASVPLARHFLADWLEHLAIDRDEVADLLLVASELCANAIRHGEGRDGALVLRAWAEGNDIVLQMEDDGTGFEPPQRYGDELPDPEAIAGRGLFLVEALTDDLSIENGDDRTVVQVRKEAILSTPRRS